jgi:glutamate synthase (NADPH/NADH) large chain
VGGEYQWRREGEYHLFNPETVFKLQHATRTGQLRHLQAVHALVDDQSERWPPCAACSSSRPKPRTPVPLDEVEPVAEIVKRFSHRGDVVRLDLAEAHETLAIAMNRIGGKSNTGEGGEDPERFTR